MKVRTSVAIDQALLQRVDKLSGRRRNRSELVEAALRAYLARARRRAKQPRDLEIINHSADVLNREAMDVLDYQIAL